MNRLRHLLSETAMFAPPDPPAGGGGGDPPPPAGDPPPPAPNAGGDPPPEPKPAPSGLAADYWDGEKGEVRYDKLVPAINDLTKFKTDAEPRLAALAEIEKQVPAKIDDYVARLPEGFKGPDGFTFEIDPNDPQLAEARAFAHKNRLTTDAFRELIAFAAKRDIAIDQQIAARFEEENRKLGAKAMDRRSAIERDLVREFGEEALTFTAGVLSAKHVEMIERLIGMAKGRGQQFTGAGREVNEGGQTDQFTEEEYEKLSPSDKINAGRGLLKPKQRKAA